MAAPVRSCATTFQCEPQARRSAETLVQHQAPQFRRNLSRTDECDALCRSSGAKLSGPECHGVCQYGQETVVSGCRVQHSAVLRGQGRGGVEGLKGSGRQLQ